MTEPDVVVDTLTKRYFELLKKEDYPKTPGVTAEADKLEQAIRELQQTNPND